MVKQYLSIKEKYNDSILFYRMGDFYEMFFEDAKVASKILEITLTARNKKDESSIPMCGIPVRAIDVYIGRLIKKGYKVAICEQIEDAATAKGLVKRDVVRVVTPGMVINDELLDEKSNNFVLALYHSDNRAALSCLDISTGTFRVAESKDLSTVIDECLRVSPSEIILPETSKQTPFFAPEKSVTFLEESTFNHKTGRERLVEQFKTRSLEGFGCENLKAALCAAGALLFYVQETQKQKIEHLTGIETYSLSNYLLIDEVSCRNLELIHNLQTGTS
ncbi:MAG: DNA mismatch repair protein MutS, partial [Deltaproteobacteria bacterium]|nr:DNA mismatch repair protein MutS [Deltaproteobacteria bacterium]